MANKQRTPADAPPRNGEAANKQSVADEGANRHRTADRRITFAVVGAGNRGQAYSGWVGANPQRARIVAVAEPREFQRKQLAADHDIPPDQVFTSWEELAGAGRLADAVIITTQDTMHVEPAVAFADLGYHLLLEKPMATTEQDCRLIVDAVTRNHVLFAVGHVMRYTPYTKALKAIVDDGRLGDIVSIQHLEPIGYWHYAHSYVRGNWRRESGSSFALMTKSCHDIDWLRYITGRRCTRVSSFGGLAHFRPENKPKGAAERCIDCPDEIESQCPYSAKRIYFRALEQGRRWPIFIVTDDRSTAGLDHALRDGPYGRCVYTSDNDVVDHQVVSMEFEGGVTANFTMTAFSPMAHRKTRIFGTRGYLDGDGETISVYDFLTERTETIHASGGGPDAGTGHGGGDAGAMDAFAAAVARQDPSMILSGPAETLDSHLVVFAAERARREGRVVTL
jgi:predicted dehydrogenase